MPSEYLLDTRGREAGAVHPWQRNARIGWSSIAFGTTLVCPCLKSKNATPSPLRGTQTDCRSRLGHLLPPICGRSRSASRERYLGDHVPPLRVSKDEMEVGIRFLTHERDRCGTR